MRRASMPEQREEAMSFEDAVEHLRLRAMRRCDAKQNVYWSLMDVSAVWTIAKTLRPVLEVKRDE